MGERYFVVGDRAFRWGRFRWVEKEGNCNNKDVFCINKISKKNCTTNLRSHCCKHVVNGTESEKTEFIEFIKASRRNSLEELSRLDERDVLEEISRLDEKDLLEKISRLDEEVIEIYEILSEWVVEDAIIVGLSVASKNKVNIFCVGNSDTDGFVDYLSEDSKNEHFCGYGIVSAFYKNIDIDSYWMLKVIENYINNKSLCIKGEAIKRIFDREKYDYEPVDSINAAFKRINYLKKSEEELDIQIDSISALYIFYHDRVVSKIEKGFYKTDNKNQDFIVEKDGNFVKVYEEKHNFSIILLFIELFYKDMLAFNMLYPSEFNHDNNRISFDKFIDHNSEEGLTTIIRYCERIKNVIKSNILQGWDSLCNDINANINSKEDSSRETKDTYGDIIIAGFTAYDIVRKFAYYYMSVLILWKIKDKTLFDYGIDKETIKTINTINSILGKEDCPEPIIDCWNVYDSLFCLSEKIKAVLPE